MRVEVADVVGAVDVIEVGAVLVMTRSETSRAVDAGKALVRAAKLAIMIASFIVVLTYCAQIRNSKVSIVSRDDFGEWSLAIVLETCPLLGYQGYEIQNPVGHRGFDEGNCQWKLPQW